MKVITQTSNKVPIELLQDLGFVFLTPEKKAEIIKSYQQLSVDEKIETKQKIKQRQATDDYKTHAKQIKTQSARQNKIEQKKFLKHVEYNLKAYENRSFEDLFSNTATL